LLADLVADIESPPMTQRAWRAAQRSRRQRLVVGVAAAGVLLVGAGAAVADGALVRRPTFPGPDVTTQDRSSSVSPPPPSAPASGDPRIQAGPERAAVADLPLLPTRFAALSGLPSSAEVLSANPVSRIVAAVQPMNGPVLVLGQDGAWREADHGNRGLFSTSISPDARRLVLTQRDGLLLIDATTGNDRLLPVPGTIGRIDSLLWLPDGDRVAVAGDGGAGVVSTTDGSYRSTEDPVHELAVSRPGDPVVQLTASELVVEDAGATVRRSYGTGDQLVLDEWYGDGWVNGSLAARTGFLGGAQRGPALGPRPGSAPAGLDGEQATFVIDVATARVTHLLVLPFGTPSATRSNGCCATLGWLDEQTVLLRDGGQVLAWRLTTGAIYRIARLPGTTAQGADPGYETAIALAQP
jgi:hypothetical protein